MNKLLIVDGSNLLFQMFFCMSARIVGKNGRAIQGVMGFVGALLKILRITKPTHVVVFFDGECQNARRELDAEYKANRPDYSDVPEDENPFSQLPYIQAALALLQIPYAETTDCETDDWIAAYARQMPADELVISSFDSDFFQLITDRVSVLRYRGEHTVILTPASIYDKFGILPAQYADFKALVGDTADNIRGISGVGPKTAAMLLGEFGTLQGVMENAAQIKRASVRLAVQEGTERLIKNRQLILLQGEMPLPLAMDQLNYTEVELSTHQILRAIGVL